MVAAIDEKNTYNLKHAPVSTIGVLEPAFVRRGSIELKVSKQNEGKHRGRGKLITPAAEVDETSPKGLAGYTWRPSPALIEKFTNAYLAVRERTGLAANDETFESLVRPYALQKVHYILETSGLDVATALWLTGKRSSSNKALPGASVKGKGHPELTFSHRTGELTLPDSLTGKTGNLPPKIASYGLL